MPDVSEARWEHSDGRPYDEIDFGATRFEDEYDVARHAAKIGKKFQTRHTNRLTRIGVGHRLTPFERLMHNEASVVARFKRFLGRLRGGSLQRTDHGSDTTQGIENTDAMSASGMRDVDPSGALGGYSFPPKYVPPADEGRPRH